MLLLLALILRTGLMYSTRRSVMKPGADGRLLPSVRANAACDGVRSSTPDSAHLCSLCARRDIYWVDGGNIMNWSSMGQIVQEKGCHLHRSRRFWGPSFFTSLDDG